MEIQGNLLNLFNFRKVENFSGKSTTWKRFIIISRKIGKIQNLV